MPVNISLGSSVPRYAIKAAIRTKEMLLNEERPFLFEFSGYDSIGAKAVKSLPNAPVFFIDMEQGLSLTDEQFDEVGHKKLWHLPFNPCIFAVYSSKSTEANAVIAPFWSDGVRFNTIPLWFGQTKYGYFGFRAQYEYIDNELDYKFFPLIDNFEFSDSVIKGFTVMTAGAIFATDCGTDRVVVGATTKAVASAKGIRGWDYRIVDLSKSKILVSEPKGGTHASPRWHLRRGHWRNLPSGKTTWVNQSEVGKKENGGVYKDYAIG